VFGNYFFPEMRTTCILLELNEINFSAENMDVFTETGRKEYISLNPGDQMPTVIRGYQTVVGDPANVYKFLCRSENID
jgi:hypothetical protein